MNSEFRIQSSGFRIKKSSSTRYLERTFEFACSIVRLHRILSRRRAADRVAANQLLRAGTSVGANLEEANAAQSRPDFISRPAFHSKKRVRRTTGSVIEATDMVPLADIHPLVTEANEIVAILTTIVKKTTTKASAS